MKTVSGDLLQLAMAGEFDVIVHGCNCFHSMGAGIAKSIAEHFPEAVDADRDTLYGMRSKLGTISYVKVQRGPLTAHDDDGFLEVYVVNAYTQFLGGAHLEIDALRSCFRAVAKRFRGDGVSIGYPMIGAGIAGGDWSKIAPVIDAELRGFDHTLVVWSTGKQERTAALRRKTSPIVVDLPGEQSMVTGPR